MTDITDVGEITEYVQRLEESINKLEVYDIPRTNFSCILENEGLLRTYHKEMNLLWKSLKLVRLIKELVRSNYKNSHDKILPYIKIHLDELIKLISAFDQEEISRFKSLIISINKTEVEELNRCVEDLGKWLSFRITNRIEFFIERVSLFVTGGKSRYDGQGFLGLNLHFKDFELVKQMYKSPAIRKLWTYKQEMEFFSWARYVTQQALKPQGEGNWELFLGTQEHNYKDGFYYNLRKGKKYIDMVRNKFGNEEFANLLERIEDKIHQSPIDWDKELAELQYRLHDFTYQNMHVIEPARQTLLVLFQNAIKRILNGKIELKEIEKILIKLESNIERKLRRLKRVIGKLRKEFDRIDDQIADQMSLIVPTIIDLTTKFMIIPRKRLIDVRQNVRDYRKLLLYYGPAISQLIYKWNVPVGAAFLAASKADELALEESRLINNPLFNGEFEPYLKQVEARITEKLNPQLQALMKLIKKYDGEFIIPISTTIDLLPEVKKLILSDRQNLSKQLEALGINFSRPLYG